MSTTVTMSPEERDRLLEEAMNAEAAGDSKRAEQLLKQIPVSAGLASQKAPPACNFSSTIREF